MDPKHPMASRIAPKQLSNSEKGIKRKMDAQWEDLAESSADQQGKETARGRGLYRGLGWVSPVKETTGQEGGDEARPKKFLDLKGVAQSSQAEKEKDSRVSQSSFMDPKKLVQKKQKIRREISETEGKLREAAQLEEENGNAVNRALEQLRNALRTQKRNRSQGVNLNQSLADQITEENALIRASQKIERRVMDEAAADVLNTQIKDLAYRKQRLELDTAREVSKLTEQERLAKEELAAVMARLGP